VDDLAPVANGRVHWRRRGFVLAKVHLRTHSSTYQAGIDLSHPLEQEIPSKRKWKSEDPVQTKEVATSR
jgi:hypothetical protein